MPDLILPELPHTFRPRLSRIYAYVIGSVLLAGTVIMAIILPYPLFGLSDRLGFITVGAVIFWFCHRQATVHVRADEHGVHVRNLFRSQQFEWAEIIDVSFVEGNPWAAADLNTGDTIGLMAFQRTDGELGIRQAKQFQALIERMS